MKDRVLCKPSGRVMSRRAYDRIYRREYRRAMGKWARLGLVVAEPVKVP